MGGCIVSRWYKRDDLMVPRRGEYVWELGSWGTG